MIHDRVTGREQEDIVAEPVHQEGLVKPGLEHGDVKVSNAVKAMLEGAADQGREDLPKAAEQPDPCKNAPDVGTEQNVTLAKSDQPEEVAVPSSSRASRVLHKLKKLFIDDVIDVYATIIKNPKLLITGTVKVLKDTLWELPKSLIKGTGNLPLKERCEMKSNQALAISELASAYGTFKAIDLFREIGVPEWVNNLLGTATGNYISAVLSYGLAYVVLTAMCKNYSFVDKLKDGAMVVKNLAPTALVMYTATRPIQVILTTAGLSIWWATAINLIWSTILFTSVASVASEQEMAKKKKF